jgi:hypothetical protein
MKKILASLIALSTIVGFASAASAQTATSVHSGSVTATCTITSTAGTFANPGLSNAMTSTGESFSTVCNSAGSKVDLTKSAESLAGGDAAVVAAAGVTSTIGAVTAGSNGAYSGITGGATTKADLSNGYSSTLSLLNVAATATAGSDKYLPSGAYSVTILATVTP